MTETKCKKFNECIQPHICGPYTDCIWGQDDADSVGIDKCKHGKTVNEECLDCHWNAAIDKCIEVANKYDSYGPAYEMRMLKK
jgi:hypothetical protein